MLSELAEQYFAPFSRAEEELFRAAQKGGEASALAKNEHENDPAKAAKWNTDRVVRAECIAWVCTDPQASTLVSYQGLDLRGMRIDGDLDLSKAKIEFFLRAQKCAFSGSILLRDTEVRGLDFSTCHIKSLNPDREQFKAFDAEGARIWGSLYLKDSCKVEGEVSLVGATIGRDLDCSGAQFSDPGSDVLSADGAKVEGDVLFNGCKAKGVVRLLGATIGGNLDCDGAQFLNPKAEALNADGGKIGGDVLLGDDFKAKGVVSVSGSTIGGNLDCSGGQFSNPGDAALQAEGAKIEGDVIFKNNFNAEGEVKLKGATIGGDLVCERAQFLNSEDDALTGDILKVKGDVTFGEHFKAEGEVRLFGAMFGGDLDCNNAQFINAEGALSCDAARIEGDVKFSGGVKAKGRVGFSGATIGGDLDCEHTQLWKGDVERASDEDEEEAAFNADGAKIKGTIFFRDRFKVEGEVSLIGATIGGDLDFGPAQFKAPEGDAISADRARIGGDVIFGDGFQAKGEVRFLGAMIGGDLECGRAEFSNSGNDALSAESAQIEGSVNLHDGLELRGCLNLENAEVGHRLYLEGLAVLEETTLNLQSAAVGSVQDDEANWKFTGNLLLDGFTYGRFHTEDPLEAKSWIKWLQRERNLVCARRSEGEKQPRNQFVPQPYEQLATVLRKMGHEREARRIMIEKNRDRARFTHFLRQGWWWYNFFGRAIGYGYAPWRAFAISLAMIFFGALLFHIGDSHNLISRTKESTLAQNAVAKFEGVPPFDPIVYSVESFTPLLKLGQSANWTPNTNYYAFQIGRHPLPFTGNFLRYYLYFHIISGWLLTSLWVGAVTGLVKS